MCRYSGGRRWRLRAQRDGCAWEYRSCTATDAEESSNHVLWYTLTSLLLIPGRGRSRRTYIVAETCIFANIAHLL